MESIYSSHCPLGEELGLLTLPPTNVSRPVTTRHMKRQWTCPSRCVVSYLKTRLSGYCRKSPPSIGLAV